MPRRVVVAWSSGKDSAWMLGQLLADPAIEVAALLTTFNAASDAVAVLERRVRGPHGRGRRARA